MSEQPRQFFNFSFFKVDPKWRWMADLAKEESAKEVEIVLKNSQIKYRTYSTLGLRDDAEFLLCLYPTLLKKSRIQCQSYTSQSLENTSYQHTFTCPAQGLLSM